MKKRMKKKAAALFGIGICIINISMIFSGVFEKELYAAETEAPVMSLEEYPHIDGSLACVPLCEKLAVRMTGCTDGEAEETMEDFSNTNPCYLYLAQNQRDLILAYEPADATKEELKEYAPLDMQPIGRDALVFITNAKNPVEDLSQEQIRDIYTGKITNWSQVGGEDIEIEAFQRPETSGSQTLMRKLLMGDQEMKEAEIELLPGMEEMIRRIKEYDNSFNALGFSVYYYASEMFQQPDLKFLRIDGISPSNDTIKSGEYPLINEFYCVTNEQSSDKAKEIQAWLISAEGQSFVEECGYVPVQ